MPKLDGRGGAARVKGPHETEEFCRVWEFKRAAGEIPSTMTGHRDGYARAYGWGRQAEREPLTDVQIADLAGTTPEMLEYGLYAMARAVERAIKGDKP